MIPNIIKGKMNKLASEVCLLDQKFVKDPDQSIAKLVERSWHQRLVLSLKLKVLLN